MRTVMRFLVTLAVLGAAAVVAALGFGQEKAEEGAQAAAQEEHAPVKALRYRMTIYHSAMDAVHQMGFETEELWFPDAGIVCNAAPEFASTVAAHAFYGGRRDVFPDALVGLDGKPFEPPPAEEIEVPWEVFEKVRALADLERKRTEMAASLRDDLATCGALPRPE